jgi:hypothetical protein
MIFEEVIKLPVKEKMSRFKNTELNLELRSRTSFLSEESGIGERVYCIDNSIKSIVLCYCGKPVNYLKYSIGYSKRCSKECVWNDKEVSKKRKETCIKKYGVDSFTKTEEYLEKTKKTNNKKYGVDFYLQTEEIKEKSIKKNIDKYGVDHHMKSKKFIKEFKKNNIEKFGVDNISKLDYIKEKKKETFNRNYGIDHIFCSNEIKGEFFQKKYGYNPYIPKEEKREFDIYKSEVWRLTYRVKKKLINDWNGYDYYDNELIKDNYNLHYNDNNYPSIDHKISIYYGFVNKIDPSIIGDIKNLCITKRSINKRKGILSEDVFKS